MSHLRLEMDNLDTPRQHLLAAFLAMEPPSCIISLARKCGGGSITEEVQKFLWSHCFDRVGEKSHMSYLKRLLKKLITEVESTGSDVLDEFYELYACHMASMKEDAPEKGESWIHKLITYICHEGPVQLVVPLQCSLNMLQGDTGCALWPSSLLLSEFILSSSEVFMGKSCFEVGSGVGLLGICLQQSKASKVILTDGDESTLANLKINLELNEIAYTDASFDSKTNNSDLVQCIHLPWESAEESELQKFMPDIILGADVIYDPSCLPHLVRVLSLLINRRDNAKASSSSLDNQNCYDTKRIHTDRICHTSQIADYAQLKSEIATMQTLLQELEHGPVALIASVIRNIDTFNCFLALSHEANILVRELTETVRALNLLPYMESYNRADVHLFLLSPVSN